MTENLQDQTTDETTNAPDSSPEESDAKSSGASHTDIELEYPATSRVFEDEEGGMHLALFTDDHRDDLRLVASPQDTIGLREFLRTLLEIVGSDFRYKAKDRSDYLAYQRSQGEGTSAALMQAQKEFFEAEGEDSDAWMMLDPILSAHPDGLTFELFSKDEGSYSSMHIDWSALDLEEEPDYGTTHVEFSKALGEEVARLRSYRDNSLSIGGSYAGGDAEDTIVTKSLQLPDRWLRGFLQVQSAATLTSERFTLAPIDLYNVLRHLRMNADQKKGGRAIRCELVPGEFPRLVLEPWEEVFETSQSVYDGRDARVIRVWGRRRLLMLKRILPYVDSVEVHLLGSGLPNFWVLRCGPITLTLGLTGFTASNWSQMIAFDQLLPRSAETSEALEQILDYLSKNWIASREDIASELGLKPREVYQALQTGCQQGQLMYDLATARFRLRPLLGEPLDLERLKYRNDRERRAYDILAGRGGSVTIESENRIHGYGTEWVGTVTIKADRREYRAEMVIGEEGRVRKAEDTSPFYRQHGLKEGPSVPLLALRLAVAQEEARRDEQRGAKTVEVETRTYVRRDDDGEHVYRITLDHRELRVRWGLRTDEKLRAQSLMFNSTDEAREAYFRRIERIEERGFMDAGG